jgi:response regulator RpfG family c-di-GMP phosphodiesterase
MNKKILFVDDDPNVLDSFKRAHGFQFEIDTALSGMEGLDKIEASGPFAVVVADYRMPRMDGIKFLNEVMKRSPDTVRLMLTGNADLQAAIDAVNQGQIFRFLTKPCPPELLTASLDAGLKQYALVNAEKDLLEKTLVESINMLTEVLSIVNPKAYGKSLRVRQLVSFVAHKLQYPGAWQYEMAAALSQLGWIIFPSELLDKIAANSPLSAMETLSFSRHPFTARKLLEKIPRLELIARMIEGQGRSIGDLCLESEGGELYFVDLGSHILNVCIDYDALLMKGLPHDAAMEEMRKNRQKYHPEILDALNSLQSFRAESLMNQVERVSIDELELGMVIVETVWDRNHNILVEKDTPVTRSLVIQLLKLSAQPGMVVLPIKVVRVNH